MAMKKETVTSRAESERRRILAAIPKDGTRDRVVGQRDMLVGLWAGTHLGLAEEGRATYALQVMAAGLMRPEPADVVDKVARDFRKQGVPIDRREILCQLSRTHRLVASLEKSAS
jgi:hypothetical protein